MMNREILSRREFMKQIGAAVSAIGMTSQSPVLSQNSVAQSLEETTARYIAKHAAVRADVFEQFRVRFRVPDDGHIEELFERSIDTSLKEALIGLFDKIFLHGSVGFVQTLAWYEQSRDLSEMYRALERGPRENYSGERWDAAQVNKKLRNRADETAAKAERHASELSEDSRQALREALTAERSLATSSEMSNVMEPWSKFDVNEISGSREGALQAVKNMGRQNLQTIESTASLVANHKDAISGADPLFFPQHLSIYRQNRQEFLSDIPDFVLSIVGKERTNLYLVDDPQKAEPGLAKRSYFIQTVNGGAIQQYDLVARKNGRLHVFTTRKTLQEVADAENPVEALTDALDDGEIVYRTQGFVHGLKYGLIRKVSSLLKDFFG